tara:strand:- start:1027 stop:2376 length:1350 start_codon:yes stop_codon:yes gene_type:complete
MSNLTDFINALRVEVEQHDSTYVYFNKDDGSIVSISGSIHDELPDNQEVVKVPQSDALPILNGDKKTTDYIVIYDISQKQKILKLKNYQDSHKEASSTCYKLPIVVKNRLGHLACKEIYDGMTVFLWAKELSYKKDDIVWYKNNVYQLKKPNYKNKGFSIKNSKLLVKDVYVTDIPTQQLSVTTLEHKEEYVGVHVDVWYDELEHLAGQHVWIENCVYKLINDQKAGTNFDPDNCEMIASNVSLHDDENKSLKFNDIVNDGDIYLKNNKLYSAKLVTNIKTTSVSTKDVIFKGNNFTFALWRYKSRSTILVDSIYSAKLITENTKLDLVNSNNLKNGEKVLLGDKLYSVERDKEYDIIITQDIRDKLWFLDLNPSTLKFFQLSHYKQDDMLYFSVTAKHDPNILYRSLKIPLNSLKEKVTIPFINKDETEDVSVYTAKYFEAYGHEIIT